MDERTIYTQNSLDESAAGKEKNWQAEKQALKKKYWTIMAVLMVVLIVAATGLVKNMWTGWRSVKGQQYYYANGKKTTGFANIENRVYFFDPSGKMQTGWRNMGGATYYFGSDGAMRTGFQAIDGKKYYFNNSGTLHNGWLKNNGCTYYCAGIDGGALATGKWEIQGQKYYFDNDGVMAIGSVQIKSGELYWFDNNGRFMYRDITKENVPSESSGSYATFTNRSGGYSRSRFKTLESGLENVLSLHIMVYVTEVTYGKATGQWQVHMRNLNGDWKKLGYFEINDTVGSFEVTFEEPISFNAFNCTRYDSSAWSGYIQQDITRVTYRSFDFGTNVKSE